MAHLEFLANASPIVRILCLPTAAKMRYFNGYPLTRNLRDHLDELLFGGGRRRHCDHPGQASRHRHRPGVSSGVIVPNDDTWRTSRNSGDDEGVSGRTMIKGFCRAQL